MRHELLALFEWIPKPKVSNIVDTTKGSIVHEETQLVASIGLASLIDPLAIVGKNDCPFAQFMQRAQVPRGHEGQCPFMVTFNGS